MFIPKLGEDEPILTSIFFRWVGSTTKQIKQKNLQDPPVDRVAPGFHGVSVGGFVEGYFEIMGHLAVSSGCNCSSAWEARN